jgi:predicted small lipoprotein YifL
MSWSFFTKEGVEKIGEFGIVGLTGGDADTLDGLDSSQYWKKSEVIAADTLEGYGSADFVMITGDTMTGALILSGSPTIPTHAANKSYVDAQAALKLNLTGGTLTGPLNLPVADPVNPTHAAHKSYVDFQIGATVAVAGDTMTGTLLLAGTPPPGLGAVPRNYVDATFLPIAGGTLTGQITQAASPTSGTHLVNRNYVDGEVNTLETYVDDQDDAIYDYVNDQIALVTSGASGTTLTSIDNTDSPYLVSNTDSVILCTSTAGVITVLLPSGAPTGKIYTIKDAAGNADTNNITIQGGGGELVDGVASYLLDTPREWAVVVFDGTNWQVIG